jgi:hypothetical protein
LRYVNLSNIITMLTLLVLLCAIGILLSRPTLEQIAQGETFFYWGHVNTVSRAPLSLVGLTAVALWFFLHRVWHWLASFRPLTILLFSLACALYTLLLPMFSLSQVAYHVESTSVQTAIGESITFHLFYQYEGFVASSCDYVLVQCDNLGWWCQQAYQFNYGALCLGDKAPMVIETSVNSLQWYTDGEIVFEWHESL